jgi:fermentation-respiration switch protein FrsA (DUF1100 family)
VTILPTKTFSWLTSIGKASEVENKSCVIFWHLLPMDLLLAQPRTGLVVWGVSLGGGVYLFSPLSHPAYGMLLEL